MKTIQVDVDNKLLKAVDRAAECRKQDRSELIREAPREHLQKLEIRASEDHDRKGYFAHPSKREQSVEWEAEAAWPERVDLWRPRAAEWI